MRLNTSSLCVRTIIFGYFWWWSMSSSLAAHELIAYDCRNVNSNTTTLSLSNVTDCHLGEDNAKIEKKHIKILKLNKFTHTKIRQCKMEISRNVQPVGMLNRMTLPWYYGELKFISDISNDTCEKMHRDLRVEYKNHVFENLQVNSTQLFARTLAGEYDNNGNFRGETYEDPYGKFDNVIVTGIVNITLIEYNARVSMDNDEIYLESGQQCRFSDNHCMDYENGQTFWHTLPKNGCGDYRKKYSLLFNGEAEKAEYEIKNQTEVVYSFQHNHLTFGLATKGQIAACDTIFIQTEHPELFIIESNDNGNDVYFPASERLTYNTIDEHSLTYINSKFTYVQKYMNGTTKSIYQNIIVQRCNREREVLKKSLSVANIAPDKFAYYIMKGPGYMTMLKGEVVHIIKCIPVPVIVDSKEERCYEELPVLYGVERYFLTPRTRILKKKGTLVNCSSVVPSMTTASFTKNDLDKLRDEIMLLTMGKKKINESPSFINKTIIKIIIIIFLFVMFFNHFVEWLIFFSIRDYNMIGFVYEFLAFCKEDFFDILIMSIFGIVFILLIIIQKLYLCCYSNL